MKYLLQIRKQLGLTQAKMANRLDLSTSYYQKVEGDFVKPGRGFIEKFKIAFPDEDLNLLFINNND